VKSINNAKTSGNKTIEMRNHVEILHKKIMEYEGIIRELKTNEKKMLKERDTIEKGAKLKESMMEKMKLKIRKNHEVDMLIYKDPKKSIHQEF
jgi:hypothetical protein